MPKGSWMRCVIGTKPCVHRGGSGKILLRTMQLDARGKERLCEIKTSGAETQALPLRCDEKPVDKGRLQGENADHHAVRFRHEASVAFRQGFGKARA